MGREDEVCGKAFEDKERAVSTRMLVTLGDFLPPTLQAGGAPGEQFESSSAAMLRKENQKTPNQPILHSRTPFHITYKSGNGARESFLFKSH